MPDGDAALSALHDRLGEGQVTLVDLDPERSKRSHNHQFGFVREAWLNLPDAYKGAPWAVNEDHLRYHALIASGFVNTDMFPMGSESRALRMAARLAQMDERDGKYSIIQVDGPVVYRVTAETQKTKVMGGSRFKESKRAILEWLADLIGVSPEDLAKMGKDKAA